MVLSALRDKGLLHLLIAIYFLKFLKRDLIDVIYCFEGLHALWIGYYCHLLTGIPLTVLVHAEMVDTKQKIALTKKALDKCYKIITISNYNKIRIIKQFHVPDEKVEVVRLFANFKEDKTTKILIVGEWSERKGHETLLKAVQEPGMEDFKVWIVGGGTWGTEYFDVEKYVKERNIEDRVVIWGKVSEDLLKLLYENCDIFCLPSRTTKKGVQEGIPVALMEAMLFGKPVISTYHTGIPELVPEILILENDHKALAEALVQLKSPELREKLGVANREIIKKNYSVRNVEGIARIIEEGIMGRY